MKLGFFPPSSSKFLLFDPSILYGQGVVDSFGSFSPPRMSRDANIFTKYLDNFILNCEQEIWLQSCPTSKESQCQLISLVLVYISQKKLWWIGLIHAITLTRLRWWRGMAVLHRALRWEDPKDTSLFLKTEIPTRFYSSHSSLIIEFW